MEKWCAEFNMWCDEVEEIMGEHPEDLCMDTCNGCESCEEVEWKERVR